MGQIPVALQMYTVREDCRRDFLATLAKVAAIGYAGVELAGLYDTPPDKLAQRLGELNLRVVAVHTGLNLLTREFQKVVDLHRLLRTPYVAVPSMPREFQGSADNYRRGAARLGELAGQLAEHGLKLVYHNHAFEFEQKFDGQYGLDILLGDPAARAVNAELDVFWIRFGQEDPVRYIKRYGGRVPLLHLKDMTGGEWPTFAEIGLGVTDFKPIFEAAGSAGVQWYVVEQDLAARPPLEAARISFLSLKKWGIA